MTVDAHAVEINVWVSRSEGFYRVLVVGKGIIAQVTITITIEVVASKRGTAAWLYVHHHESKLGEALVAIVVERETARYLVVLRPRIRV